MISLSENIYIYINIYLVIYDGRKQNNKWPLDLNICCSDIEKILHRHSRPHSRSAGSKGSKHPSMVKLLKHLQATCSKRFHWKTTLATWLRGSLKFKDTYHYISISILVAQRNAINILGPQSPCRSGRRRIKEKQCWIGALPLKNMG